MGIFDNAKSILIGDKEVKSLEIDGGTIWEKEIEPPTPSSRSVTLTYLGEYDAPKINHTVTIDGDNLGNTDTNGAITVTLTDGAHQVSESNVTPTEFTVDETHTSFTIKDT